MAEKKAKKTKKQTETPKGQSIQENTFQKGAQAVKEEKTLEFWQKNKIFEKSVSKDAPKGEFVFYDGPPFANGLPHYGHILASVIKDAVPRYKTMNGFRVARRWGWDCHGLPVENEVEKKLGLKTKKEIEEYGLEKFSEEAGKTVLEYTSDWKKIIPRLGRFVDMENDYRTMDTSFTESVWWVFKSLYDKDLIYEDFKSMHLCPRCGTTLSNFEVNQGYKDITDISVYVKFRLIENRDTNIRIHANDTNEDKTYLLAWTTTPWTLPGNVALAVGPDIEYVKIKVTGVVGDKPGQNLDKTGVSFYVAKNRLDVLEKVGVIKFEILAEISGKDLIGLEYEPLFDYYSKDTNLKNRENGWKIYGADFVTTEDGTGIVHIAPAFGEDDMALGREKKLPFIQHVGHDGAFKKEVIDFAGEQVKPKDDHQKADIEVIKHLAHSGVLFEKEKIIHPYPHCWRCDTPLLNYASSSWFVKVSDFKDKLVSENKKINWIPKDIQEGRFGKWLEGARDWAISRSRFWGAPLPVWKCHKCEEIKVVGSVEEMKKLSEKKNNYFVMRHGQAENNVQGVVSCNKNFPHHLTEVGREQAKKTAGFLADKKIDLIMSSPFVRTKETAEIVAEGIGLGKEKISFDDRLGEVDAGIYNGRNINEYRALFSSGKELFEKSPQDGENYRDIKRRMAEFIFETDEKHKGKNILVVTHEDPAWMLFSASKGLGVEGALKLSPYDEEFLKNAEVKEMEFFAFPHNKDFELDLHRPYIDSVKFACPCGGEVKRIPEVFDCWFESGSMPYGQFHYPFENKEIFEPKSGFFKKSRGFPADFIAEGLDQTRGWFYSMLVLSVALFGKTSYKNVIVNGIVLAENGEKMSKRLKNYPDPIYLIDKYGVDALRYYLLSSPVVSAQDLKFAEKGVDEISKKLVGRLLNVCSFYELYKGGLQYTTDVLPESLNVLDMWIVERLGETASSVGNSMEKYELDRAVRPIMDFVDDLSTWYLRRSRERFKGDNEKDKRNALLTTKFVLKEFSKITAPFMPFLAEEIYEKVKTANDKESVHLENWTGDKSQIANRKSAVLEEMSEVRKIVSLGLEARMKAGIKVRQPLAKLRVKNKELRIKNKEEYLDLIRDEVNVKEIVFDEKISDDVELDTNITKELREEGWVREFVRNVQDLRKEMKLIPTEFVSLVVNCGNIDRGIIERRKEEIKRVTVTKNIKFDEFEDGTESEIESSKVRIKIVK